MRLMRHPIYVFAVTASAVVLVGLGVAAPEPSGQTATAEIRIDGLAGTDKPLIDETSTIKDGLVAGDLVTEAAREAKLLPATDPPEAELAKLLASIHDRIAVDVSSPNDKGDVRVMVRFRDDDPAKAKAMVEHLSKAYAAQLKAQLVAEAEKQYEADRQAAEEATKQSVAAEDDLHAFLENHFNAADDGAEPASRQPLAAPAPTRAPQGSRFPAAAEPRIVGQLPEIGTDPSKALIEAFQAENVSRGVLSDLRNMPDGPYDPATLGDVDQQIQDLPEEEQASQLNALRRKALRELRPAHPYIRAIDARLAKLGVEPDTTPAPEDEPEKPADAKPQPAPQAADDTVAEGYRTRWDALQSARAKAKELAAEERTSWEHLVHVRAARIEVVGANKAQSGASGATGRPSTIPLIVFFALGAGLLAAYLSGLTESKVANRDDAEKILQLPVVGEVPADDGLEAGSQLEDRRRHLRRAVVACEVVVALSLSWLVILSLCDAGFVAGCCQEPLGEIGRAIRHALVPWSGF